MYILTIQESFIDVVMDIETGRISSESVWIARRNTDNEDHQEYYSVSVHLENGQLAFSSKTLQGGEIKVRRILPREFQIVIEDDAGSSEHSIIFPSSKLNLHLKRSKASTSAISPNGSRFIIGTECGEIFSFDTTSEKEVSEIVCAHFTDITKIAVFPSSEVMLSVGADLSTKLWSVGENMEIPVRIFKKHKAQITGIVLIDRGRNFMTSSMDGSVLLWECSSAQVVSAFRRIDDFKDPATCMALTRGKTISEDITIGGDFLFGCEDKYVFVGYKSGIIQQYSVAGHFQTKIQFQRSSAVTSLSAHGRYVLAGYADGLIRIYDMDTTKGDTTKKESQKDSWDLQLNPNHAVEHISICKVKTTPGTLAFVIFNGPEFLLRVEFDGTGFKYKQLVGLDEMFRAISIEHRDDSIFVATQTAIVQF